MRRLSAGTVFGLCAAAALAGFAVGRLVPARPAAPAPAELAGALRAAIGEPDPLERFEQTTRLLRHLDPGSMVEVAAVYDAMLAELDAWDLRPFVHAWALFDPAGAFAHVLAWPMQGKREIGVEAALETWARLSLPAARQAFEKAVVEHPRLEDELSSALVTGWVHSSQGADGLAGFLAQLPTATREDSIRTALRELLRRGGVDAALAWAAPILDGDYAPQFQRSVFRRSTRSVARWEPERAAAWVVEHADAPYSADGLRIVAGQWAGRDGLAVMAWLREQPEGPPRDGAVGKAFGLWAKWDPLKARAWLESESLEPFHDGAIAAHAAELAEVDAQEGFGWCERMSNPEGQQRCVVGVATRWYRRDAPAAEAWLAESSLDDQAKRQVKTRRRQQGSSGPRRPRPR